MKWKKKGGAGQQLRLTGAETTETRAYTSDAKGNIIAIGSSGPGRTSARTYDDLDIQ